MAEEVERVVLADAVELARQTDDLVLLGQTPTGPSSAFGYLVRDGNRVVRFVEEAQAKIVRMLDAFGDAAPRVMASSQKDLSALMEGGSWYGEGTLRKEANVFGRESTEEVYLALELSADGDSLLSAHLDVEGDILLWDSPEITSPPYYVAGLLFAFVLARKARASALVSVPERLLRDHGPVVGTLGADPLRPASRIAVIRGASSLMAATPTRAKSWWRRATSRKDHPLFGGIGGRATSTSNS